MAVRTSSRVTCIANQNGMSLVEVLVAAGLISLVIGLSVTPLMEIKKLEKRVEFQSGLDISHQLALQKARNGEYIKTTLGITAGSAAEACFAGRGTGCTAYKHFLGEPSAETPTDSVSFTQNNGYTAKSDIFINAACGGTTCTSVNVRVSTVQLGGVPTEGWVGRPLEATFTLPASSLAGRQEINFLPCNGRIITGVDYDALTAECAALTGTSTCAGIAAGGPMNTFGRATASAANCQPPVNQTCARGMDSFGMISGQASCAPAMVCSDPMSAACSPAPTPAPTACAANYQPLASTRCAGEAFTQIDANACPTSVAQPAVGTNPAVCPVTSCTMAGPVRWPDPATGPCEVVAPSVSAPASGAGVAINERNGYYGTFTATCNDNSPAAATFNMAGATTTCAPTTCTGLPSSLEWSSAGVKSGVAGPGLDAVGPWPCSGPLTLIQSLPQAAGVLVSTQTEAAARGVSANTSPLSSAGGVTLTCNDPGPLTIARSGDPLYSAVTCTPLTPTPAPEVAPICTPSQARLGGSCANGGHPINWSYVCLTSTHASYSWECASPAETIIVPCPQVVLVEGLCSGDPPVATPTPVPTPVPTPGPVCQPDGYTTGSWGGFEDSLCMSVSSFGPALTTQPYATCCSGFHTPTYGPGDTVGGGNCYWRCGTGGGPPPGPTAAPTPAAALCPLLDGFEANQGDERNYCDIFSQVDVRPIGEMWRCTPLGWQISNPGNSAQMVYCP